MELTLEEKKKILEAALHLGKVLSELYMSQERAKAISNLTRQFLAFKLDARDLAASMTTQYEEAYEKAMDGLFEALDVHSPDDPFCAYLNAVAQQNNTPNDTTDDSMGIPPKRPVEDKHQEVDKP